MSSNSHNLRLMLPCNMTSVENFSNFWSRLITIHNWHWIVHKNQRIPFWFIFVNCTFYSIYGFLPIESHFCLVIRIGKTQVFQKCFNYIAIKLFVIDNQNLAKTLWTLYIILWPNTRWCCYCWWFLYSASLAVCRHWQIWELSNLNPFFNIPIGISFILLKFPILTFILVKYHLARTRIRFTTILIRFFLSKWYYLSHLFIYNFILTAVKIIYNYN